MDVNFFGVVSLLRHCIPVLEKRSQAAFIILSNIAGVYAYCFMRFRVFHDIPRQLSISNSSLSPVSLCGSLCLFSVRIHCDMTIKGERPRKEYSLYCASRGAVHRLIDRVANEEAKVSGAVICFVEQ